MFLIIVMGALVTKTDSGLGCGYEWPLCNGKFVPAYTISSMIEYSHRAVVAIFVLLLLITTYYIFKYSNSNESKWLVVGVIFFTLLQAAMGAFAVVIPQSSAILALHFGLSLLAYVFCFLLAMYYHYPSFFQMNNKALTSILAHRSSTNFRFNMYLWSIIVYTYIVVYLGAFVRHTDSSGGCSGWPLCNGEVIPELEGATGIVFMHRIAALVLFICIFILHFKVKYRFPIDSLMYRSSKWVWFLLIMQIASGALVTFAIGSDTLYLFTAMIHAVLITLLFGWLSLMGFLTIRYRSISS